MHRTDIQINATDWARVKAEAGQDAPIPWDEPSEPYNPDDASSVTDYWQQSTIRHGVGNSMHAKDNALKLTVVSSGDTA